MNTERTPDYIEQLAGEGWKVMNHFLPLEIGQIGILSESHLEYLNQQYPGCEIGVIHTQQAVRKGINWGLHKENRELDDPLNHRLMYQVIVRKSSVQS